MDRCDEREGVLAISGDGTGEEAPPSGVESVPPIAPGNRFVLRRKIPLDEGGMMC